MKIIKRNGSEVAFDKTRIEKALLKAGKEADNELTPEIAKEIADFIEQEALKEGHSLSVEDIQDLVETELMKHGLYKTAKLFISYRYKRTLLRKGNTTDARILSLIEENNEDVKQENSNKNPTVVSVQRDYMAGEVSKDITRRFLLPPDIVKAHDEGIIHFHDADYFSQHSHNCGASWTRFITSEGIKEFGKCRDGEEVEVLDMYGEWRKATVHKFGRQKLYDITLKSESCEKVVSFTSNHRWILKDGTVTESLKVGDVLWGTREIYRDWKPSTIREYNMFALGLVIGDGCDIRKGFGGVRVRLCGKKTRYSEVLSKCGFKISKLLDSNDLVATASSKWFKKQDFLNGKSWQYLSKEDKNALFRGYFSADGNAYKEASSRRCCSTADDRIAQMIRDISPFAGFHLIKEREIIHDTQYKKNARLINFTFIVKQEKEKCCWTVVGIKERRHGKESSYQDVWCVVEPITHSFTLEGGVVTGNCFSERTRFITKKGVKPFSDFKDGDKVEVLDKNGEWREATVHLYGKQQMWNVTLERTGQEKAIVCTADHRWILQDGQVTSCLRTGDVLYKSPRDVTGDSWKVRSMTPVEGENAIQDAWCIYEPETHTFTLENGIPTGNCFFGETKFVTRDGVRKFKECRHGESVEVLNKDGEWKTATVNLFGKQKLQDVTFRSCRTIKTITCTKDHRWILKDGTITDNLKVGDSLYPLKPLEGKIEKWTPSTKRECKMFLLGFGLGDGNETPDKYFRVPFFGKKVQYASIIEKAGYKSTWGKDSHGNSKVETYLHGFLKQDFLNMKGWRYINEDDKKALFIGYYSADGNSHCNCITTADDRLAEMIREISVVAGYHITSEKEIIHDTQYKKNARLILFRFMRSQPHNRCWKVIDIKTHGKGYHNVWCVTEPETHSFTLEGGIVSMNCDLVNLDDMLQNGTVISGTKIDRPHSFSTACNIATQIIAQVASCQYGGQSITLSHLAPFVQVSREKIKRELETSLKETGIQATEYQLHEMIEKRVRDEIKKGVQTIQYQVITLMTTNGQAPFITVFMYLNEVPEGQIRDDLALIIEEALKQRKQGVKNESGAWITPAFPKLIYVLQPDNIVEGSRYFYLTRLAAECTAKRMVPDYISEKKMLELKIDAKGNGNCYPCMGCVDGKEVVSYKLHGLLYTESIERMWERLSDYYELKTQPNGIDFFLDTPGVEIYDQKKGFVKNYRIIKNKSNEWMNIQFSSGRSLTCTIDHPFETENRGVVLAKDLLDTDLIAIDRKSIEPENGIDFNINKAWLFGFLLCDSTYYDAVMASIALKGEDDIEKNVRDIINLSFGLDVKTIERHRGVKGEYKDLLVLSDGTDKLTALKCRLIQMFEGKAKRDRHISPEVFRWSRESRLAFLAGMIDADGYVNNNHSITTVQLGSTNKELALQQMNLIQSLGMEVSTYQNHYRGRFHENSIRYLNEFTPSKELIDSIHCKKKQDHLGNTERTNESVKTKEFISPTSVKMIDREAFSYDVTTESEHFTVSGIYSHNCRSFLTPYVTENGEPKYYGRFNQGVVTLNLVDVALSSGKDFDKFWQLMSERLELCHRALRTRHERLLGTSSDVAPILWQNGALARLPKGEKIDKLLFGGYSTISLGYAGLYECVYYMTGKSHTDEEAKPFALSVMKALNDACKRWKTAENIDYSVYGTPLESTTYKFAKCLKKRFGVIPGVTDRNYITNSYHVHVSEKIDAFTKLSFESEFQELSPGGAISYVEVPNMENNIEAVLALLKHIYQNIMYAELNTKSDFCQVCSYSGEIQIVEDSDGKLVWECPRCGNRDQTKMNVARRTCGYIGTQYWNQGRTQEIRERVLHL